MSKNRLVSQEVMLFPAITICNYNPFRNTDEFKKLKLSYLKRETSETKQQGRKSFNTSDTYASEPQMDIEQLYHKFGHQMNAAGMLGKCIWKGRTCNEANFSSTTQSMGLCHTFNSGNEKSIRT